MTTPGREETTRFLDSSVAELTCVVSLIANDGDGPQRLRIVRTSGTFEIDLTFPVDDPALGRIVIQPPSGMGQTAQSQDIRHHVPTVPWADFPVETWFDSRSRNRLIELLPQVHKFLEALPELVVKAVGYFGVHLMDEKTDDKDGYWSAVWFRADGTSVFASAES